MLFPGILKDCEYGEVWWKEFIEMIYKVLHCCKTAFLITECIKKKKGLGVKKRMLY